MAWVRIDDHFDEHPKMAKVGPIGWGVWMAGLAYCNRNLTDGFIPWTKARTLTSFEFVDGDGVIWELARGSGADGRNVTADWVIGLLISARLWDEVEGGYRVHHYELYQPLKAQIEEERAKKRAAGQAGGQAAAIARAQADAKQVLQQNQSTNSSETLAKSNPKPNPTPTPVPTPKTEPTGNIDGTVATDAAPKSARGSRFSSAAELTQEWIDAAVTLTFTEEQAFSEFEEFRDYWCAVAGSKGVKLDWLATWRNHLRRRLAQRGGLTSIKGGNRGTYRGKYIGLTNEQLDEMIARESS